MNDFVLDGRFNVESILDFRIARLLLVFDEIQSVGVVVDTIDRIGYLDYFASNPFSIVGDDEKSKADRLALVLAGFSDRQLSYHSVGHRYVSRRKTLQNDLSIMLAIGMLSIDESGYGLTERGKEAAGRLVSVYGESIRASSRLVARRIGRLSRKRLNEVAERALGKSWLLLDLLDDVRDAEVLETGNPNG